LALVVTPAVLSGLAFVRHWNTDAQEEQGVCYRSEKQPVVIGRGDDYRKSNKPPHEYFAEVIGVA